MKNHRKSQTGGEPTKRHKPLTASLRRERVEKHNVSSQVRKPPTASYRKNKLEQSRAEKERSEKERRTKARNDILQTMTEYDVDDDEGSGDGEDEGNGGGDDEASVEESEGGYEVGGGGGDDKGSGEEREGGNEVGSGGDDDEGSGEESDGGNEVGSGGDDDGSGEESEGGCEVGGGGDENEVSEDDDIILEDYPLYEQGHDHVAYYLGKKIDRGPLQCKQSTSKIKSWDVTNEPKEVKALIKNSLLYPLCDGSYRIANRVLASAFVERWHPETTTFHMPFGEVTITLDDVQQLLNIPTKGRALIYDPTFMGEAKTEEWVGELLGIPRQIVKAELAECKGNSVRTQWIIQHLSKDGPHNLKATPEQVARGYFLVLLGCTLFQNRTGTRVFVKYLYFLQDLKSLDKWAWGAGALAYLYRMLGKSSTFSSKGLTGYLTLLEAWIYEHFPSFRPGKSHTLQPKDILPRRWKPASQMRDVDARKNLKYIRGEIDNMTKKDFVWTPYRSRDENPNGFVWFTGCLVVDKILEPHHPNRVVRQFGRVQDKPTRPIKAKFTSRRKIKAYVARYYNSPEDFNDFSSHLVSRKNRGARATEDGQCTVEYEHWYASKALVKLNHEIPSSIFQAHDNEEGHWMTKVIEYGEGFVKKGLKLSKLELLNALENVVTKLKEGPCQGPKTVENEEPGKKKFKFVEEARKKKSNPGVVIQEPSSSEPLRPKRKTRSKKKGKGVVVYEEHKKSRNK